MNQHIIVLEISMVAPLEMWWKREEPRRLIVSSDRQTGEAAIGKWFTRGTIVAINVEMADC
jgi:hypothetical protein